MLILVALVFGVAADAYGFLGVPASPTPPPSWTTLTSTQGLCASRTVGLSVIPVYGNPVPINATSVWHYPIYLTVQTIGQACDGYGNDITVRHEVVTLAVRDLTHPFNATDIWFATLDLAVVADPPSSGVTYSLPTVATVVNLGPGSAVHLGNASVEWDPHVATRLNLTFSETVFPDPNRLHAGDTLRFTVGITLFADNTACFGACWSPFFGESFNQTLSFDAQVVSA